MTARHSPTDPSRAEPAEPTGEAEETLSDAYWGVARQLRHLSWETLQPWEVTPGQARAVGVLMRHGVLRLNELSEHLRIAARSTTEVVDGLETRGLVERRPDPDDRRATLVALTPAGRAAGTAVSAARSAEAERFFGRLSATDQAHLRRILRKLRG